MSAKIEAVIWDIGGVLWRNEDESSRYRLAEKYGVSLEDLYSLIFDSESSDLAELGKIDEVEHWKTIAFSIGIPPEDVETFRNEWWSGNRFDDDLFAFIKSLRPHFKVGILSNAWSDARNIFSQKVVESGISDYMVYSAEVGLRKPEHAIYKKILDMMQVSPEKAIFIDDLEKNVSAANQLGIKGILFTSADQARNDILAMIRE